MIWIRNGLSTRLSPHCFPKRKPSAISFQSSAREENTEGFANLAAKPMKRQKSPMLHAVILAGGGGTRLWPLSRTQFPKQFLSLLGEQTLLQQTVLRLGTTVPPQCVWIVTGKDQQFMVQSQLASLPGMSAKTAHVLTEPLGRNTAAAIGLAALHIQRSDPAAVMIVLPADHWIEQPSA